MNSIEELIDSIQGKLDRLAFLHGRPCTAIISNPAGAPIEIKGRRDLVSSHPDQQPECSSLH